MRHTPYFYYLRKLAIEAGVLDNLKFVGVLSSKEMAMQMKTSNVFIMPSAIENLSTTLREAMLVGTPCVAANVGCVSEYLYHGDNGFVYRYEEFELLANYVMYLFDHPEVAVLFSKKGPQTIFDKYIENDTVSSLISIYKSVLGKTTK